MIFLFFLLSLFPLAAADVVVSTKQDKTALFMDERLKCSIEVTYPEQLTPLTEEFLSKLQKSDMPSFSLISQNVEKKPGFVRFSFELQPQKLGRCIFAPGFLHFAPDESMVLLSAIEATCKKSGISDLVYVAPLPLYPEQKIDLSLENSLKLMSEKALQSQVAENNRAISEYYNAWGYVLASLIIVASSALFFWALVQYELLVRAKMWIEPKKDPLLTLLQEAQNKNREIGVRWQALFHLVQRVIEKKEETPCRHATIEELVALLTKSRLPDEERTFFTEVCAHIEAVSYANAEVAEEVLEGYCRRFQGLVFNRLL